MAALRLGIDLGGTKALAVAIDAEGVIRGELKQATPEGGYDAVLDGLAQMIAELRQQVGVRQLATIGLGLPGPVDPDRGVVQRVVNLGWDEPMAVAADLGKRLDARVVLGNDVNFGALGEVFHGAAKGAATACAAFVGTGLGGALIRDGHVVNGANGIAGEIGHLHSPFGRGRCGCGHRGCLETVCSKRGIARQLRKHIDAGKDCAIRRKDLAKLKSSHLRQALDKDCKATRRAVERLSEALGWGLAVFGAAADPQVYVVGGGVIEALADEIMPEVKRSMARNCVFLHEGRIDLRRATLGDHAVAVGAAVASSLKEPTRW